MHKQKLSKRMSGHTTIILHPYIIISLLTMALIVILAGGLCEQYLPFITNGSAHRIKNHTLAPPQAHPISTIKQLTPNLYTQQLARLAVSRMSLDEEIGQLIMVEYPESSYSLQLDTMIHQLYAGGVIMFQRQINTQQQTSQDTEHMQQRANIPLLIATDEEGQTVHRLTNIYPSRLSAFDIYASKSTAVATAQGQQVAHDLLSLGINTNLAPDVDVSSAENYIGNEARSFGPTPQDVITYAGAYMWAMQSNGVIATLKHFPGLGSAPKSTDPHVAFVTIPHTKQQLYNIDLVPFAHFIHSTNASEQPGMIMATDELVPSIDPKYVAELSPTFITTILRQQLGYNGVIISDDLQMLGVQIDGHYPGIPQAAVLALKAGDDMLLGPNSVDSMQATIRAIKVALNNGMLTKARLDDAATHILTLKMERNLIPSA